MSKAKPIAATPQINHCTDVRRAVIEGIPWGKAGIWAWIYPFPAAPATCSRGWFVLACAPIVGESEKDPALQRVLGPISALAITVGGVIGSGIFLKPWDISKQLPDERSIYLCWIVLGLTCLFGAFAYAELGCMFPEAGGQYAFLREGWGRLVAFLYGWCFF